MAMINTTPESDLDLIGLDMNEVGKLDNDTWWDYEHQLQHHCIRLAWKKAFLHKLPVRACLKAIYAKRFIASEKARGYSVSELDLTTTLEELRMFHELNMCLGFFVDAEAERIFRGATEPCHPSSVSLFTPRFLGVSKGQFPLYMYAASVLRILQTRLAAPWRSRDGEFVEGTLRAVEQYAAGPNHLYVSPRLERLVEIADERAVIERQMVEAGNAHREADVRA